MSGTAEDWHCGTDSTTSSDWSDFSLNDLFGPGVNAEDTQSPLPEVAGRPDPIGSYAQANDYGGTEKNVLSLYGFSGTAFRNASPHAARHETPPEYAVLMYEAPGAPIVRAASPRPGRVAGVPSGM